LTQQLGKPRCARGEEKAGGALDRTSSHDSTAQATGDFLNLACSDVTVPYEYSTQVLLPIRRWSADHLQFVQGRGTLARADLACVDCIITETLVFYISVLVSNQAVCNVAANCLTKTR
jgi:hypothetical protein